MTTDGMAGGLDEAALLPATYLQEGLWPGVRRAQPGEAFRARAVRITGPVEVDRLRAAVRQVCADLPGLAVNLVERDDKLALRRRGEPAVVVHDVSEIDATGRDAATVDLLRADRDRRTDIEPGCA